MSNEMPSNNIEINSEELERFTKEMQEKAAKREAEIEKEQEAMPKIELPLKEELDKFTEEMQAKAAAKEKEAERISMEGALDIGLGKKESMPAFEEEVASIEFVDESDNHPEIAPTTLEENELPPDWDKMTQKEKATWLIKNNK